MTDVLRLLDRVLIGLSAAIAITALTLAFSVGTIQIVSRFILHVPTPWSDSALRVALVWSVFAAVPPAIRNGALLRVNLLDRKLTGTPYHEPLRWFVAGCSVVVLLTMLIAGTGIAQKFSFQKLPGLNMSMKIAYAAIPFAGLFGLFATAAAYFWPVENADDIDESIAE